MLLFSGYSSFCTYVHENQKLSFRLRRAPWGGKITWETLSAEEYFGVFFSLQESHTEEHEGEEQVHEQPQQQEEYWLTRRLWQFSFCVRTFFWRTEHVWPQTWNQFTPSLPLTFMYHSECQPTTAFCTHTLPRCICRRLLSVYLPKRL